MEGIYDTHVKVVEGSLDSVSRDDIHVFALWQGEFFRTPFRTQDSCLLAIACIQESSEAALLRKGECRSWQGEGVRRRRLGSRRPRILYSRDQAALIAVK
jgi:hypothetical protein